MSSQGRSYGVTGRVLTSVLAASAILGLACPASQGQEPAPNEKSDAPEGATNFEAFRLEDAISLPELWETTIEAVVESQAGNTLGLAWTSEARDAARAARPLLFYLGVPAQELLLRAEQGIVKEATLIFFARGNWWAKLIGKQEFDDRVRSIVAALNNRTGREAEQPGRDPSNVASAYVLHWSGSDASYELIYNFQKSRQLFLPEFIRLEIRPPVTGTKPLVQVKPGTTLARGLERAERASVRRDANGDVWLEDVPMVDQGERGYCVVASAERVLRYYGVETDQHELAQIAGAHAFFGTDPMVMNEALRKVSARLKVRPREIVTMDFRDFERIYNNYNRVAKTMKKRQAAYEGASVLTAYADYSIEVLRQSRARDRNDFSKFVTAISENIERRIPLLWSVQLGIVKEPEIPQAAGGHMRLIIGYNPKTREILYSDSWGAGHELKRMDLADGWAITTGLSILEPKTG